MNTRRFEMVINDSSENRDDKYIELQKCLKDVWEEYKKLKAEIAPGLWQQYKEFVKEEHDRGYKWLLFLILQPAIALLALSLLFGALNIGACNTTLAYDEAAKVYYKNNQQLIGYTLVQEERKERPPCTTVYNLWAGPENDGPATKCFEDPFDAIRALKELNHASGFHYVDGDSVLPLSRENE